MVNSWERRTSFRPLRLTNTLKDKSECFMSSNGELDASNGTQQNIKENKKLTHLVRVRFCMS